MQKIKELIREVYHYEKKSEIETRYLSNVLLWFCLMVFLINLFNNGMKKNPGIYIFCLVVCVIGVWDAFHIRNAKNVELPVKVVTILLLVSSVYCIYFGGNDGFQNLWFFIAPSILLLLVGLPFGVPCWWAMEVSLRFCSGARCVKRWRIRTPGITAFITLCFTGPFFC